MPLNSFESSALRALAKRINEYITANAENLAFGSSIVQDDVNATAQNYCSAVAYMRALRDVLGMCEEVEDELLGRGKKQQ